MTDFTFDPTAEDWADPPDPRTMQMAGTLLDVIKSSPELQEMLRSIAIGSEHQVEGVTSANINYDVSMSASRMQETNIGLNFTILVAPKS